MTHATSDHSNYLCLRRLQTRSAVATTRKAAAEETATTRSSARLKLLPGAKRTRPTSSWKRQRHLYWTQSYGFNDTSRQELGKVSSLLTVTSTWLQHSLRQTARRPHIVCHVLKPHEMWSVSVARFTTRYAWTCLGRRWWRQSNGQSAGGTSKTFTSILAYNIRVRGLFVPRRLLDWKQ